MLLFTGTIITVQTLTMRSGETFIDHLFFSVTFEKNLNKYL